MFNLSDILQSAQGGNAIANLAEQFGLPPDQAQQAVNALLPALSAGLKSRANDPAAVGETVDKISDAQHQAAFQSSDAAQSDEAQMAGHDAITHLLGGDDAIAAVSQRAAQATGLSPELLQQMLPQVASIALGGVMTAMQNRGLGGVVAQLNRLGSSGELGAALGQTPGQSGQPGGLGGVIGSLISSFLGSRSPATGAPGAGAPSPSADAQAGFSALTSLFEHGASTSPNLEQDFAQLIDKK